MKSATLKRGDAFGHQLRPAVDQTRFLRAILFGVPWNGIVVGLVRLAQIGRVGVGNGALVAHPQQGSAGVQPARESNTDLLADRYIFEYGCHCWTWPSE